MTREEFEEITTFDSLICIAEDYGCDDIVENIYMPDSYDECVADIAHDYLGSYGWRDCESFLYNLPREGDVFYRDDYDDWHGAFDGDSDFHEFKQQVYDYIVEYVGFDDDEEEEAEEETVEEAEPEDEVESFECEDVPFECFSEECANELRTEVISRKPSIDDNGMEQFFEFI